MAFGFISPRPKSRTSGAPPRAPLNSTSNISSPVPLPNSPTTFYPSRLPPPASPAAPPITSRIPISPNSRLPQPKPRAPDPSTPPSQKSKTVRPLTPPPTTSRISARTQPPATTTPTSIPKRIPRKPSTGPNFLQRLTSPSLPSSSSNKLPTSKSPPATSPPPSQPTKLPVLGLAIEWEKPVPKPVVPPPSDDASHDEFDSSDGIASYSHFSRTQSAFAASGRTLESSEETSRRWSRELGEGTLKFGMERVLKLDERAGRGEDDGSWGGGRRREVVRLDSTESVPRLQLNEFGILEGRYFKSGQGAQPSSSSSSIRGFSKSLPARSSSSSPASSNGGGGPQISAAFGTRRSISISPFLSSSSLSVASSSTSSSGAPVYFLNGIPREGGVGGESRRGSIRASCCSSTFGETRRSEAPSPSPRQGSKTLGAPPSLDQEEESPTSTPPSVGFTLPSTQATYTPPPLPTAPSSPPLSPPSPPPKPLPPPKLHRTISPPTKSLASTRRPSSPPPPLPPHKLRSVPPLPQYQSPTFPPSVISLQTVLSDSTTAAVGDQEGWSVSISTSTSSSPAPTPVPTPPEGSISYTVVLSPPPPKSTQHQPQTSEHPTPLLTPCSSPQLVQRKLSSSSSPSSTLPTSPTSPSPSHGFIAAGGTWKAPTRATMVHLVLPLSLGERGTGAGVGGTGRLTFLSLPTRGERGSA